MEQEAQVAQQNPRFFTITKEGVNAGAMYDVALGLWHDDHVVNVPAGMAVFPVASAGGLICFRDTDNASLNFCVFNPLNGSFGVLPPRQITGGYRRVAVGMTITGRSTDSGYKIMWVGGDGEYDVYDSQEGNWSWPGNMPAGFSVNCESRAVSIGSTHYFLCANPEGFISYDMITLAWQPFLIPAPLHLTYPSLCEFNNQIMLVGLRTENGATSVCVWERQIAANSWEVVSLNAIIHGLDDIMYCLGNKGWLVLTSRNHVVTYNMATQQWLGVVRPGANQQWIRNGITFHPSEAAMA